MKPITIKVVKREPTGNAHRDSTPYEATVIGGWEMSPSAHFMQVGSSIAEAIGGCIIANREALGVQFDLYEGDTLTGRSTVYGRTREQERE